MTLFMRPACHLCHEAAQVLQQANCWPVVCIDIDDDDELGARYGLRIPVLQRADGMELDWPFDVAAIIRFTAAK